MIETNGVEATQRIVDICGDGMETRPWNRPWNQRAVMLSEARSAALAQNVTVNGLAITIDEPALATWYRQNVLVGPRSFVIDTNDFQGFRRAIRRKLLRELGAPPTS